MNARDIAKSAGVVVLGCTILGGTLLGCAKPRCPPPNSSQPRAAWFTNEDLYVPDDGSPKVDCRLPVAMTADQCGPVIVAEHLIETTAKECERRLGVRVTKTLP